MARERRSWRRLAVRFPETNANHNLLAFMLRRMDYSPDITANSLVAHYTHDPKTFDGFVFPTRRRVHTRDADGNADQSLAVITVDVPGVSVRRC